MIQILVQMQVKTEVPDQVDRKKRNKSFLALVFCSIQMQYFSKAYCISISCHVSNAFELSEKLHLLAPMYTAESYQVN